MMETTEKKPLTAAQKRQRALNQRAWLRAGIQALFFAAMPGAFVAGFAGVRQLFLRIGTGSVLQLDSFTLSLLGLCLTVDDLLGVVLRLVAVGVAGRGARLRGYVHTFSCCTTFNDSFC